MAAHQGHTSGGLHWAGGWTRGPTSSLPTPTESHSPHLPTLVRPGACPPRAAERGALECGPTFCIRDQDCPKAHEKCCRLHCGWVCTAPVTAGAAGKAPSGRDWAGEGRWLAGWHASDSCPVEGGGGSRCFSLWCLHPAEEWVVGRSQCKEPGLLHLCSGSQGGHWERGAAPPEVYAEALMEAGAATGGGGERTCGREPHMSAKGFMLLFSTTLCLCTQKGPILSPPPTPLVQPCQKQECSQDSQWVSDCSSRSSRIGVPLGWGGAEQPPLNFSDPRRSPRRKDCLSSKGVISGDSLGGVFLPQGIWLLICFRRKWSCQETPRKHQVRERKHSGAFGPLCSKEGFCSTPRRVGLRTGG